MSDPYLGEIRVFAGNYAPEGWMICDGRTLNISGNEALYALIGVTYGGNGTTNFNIPDLRGRVPVGQGQGANLTNRVVGQIGGTSAVQLVEANIPAHTHSFSVAGTPGTVGTPAASSVLSIPQTQAGGTIVAYTAPGTSGITDQVFDTAAVSTALGGGQPHSNLMPYIAINYIMATNGLFPSRSN